MVTLAEITWDNFWDVMNLKPTEAQQDFLAPIPLFLSLGYVNLKSGYPDALYAIESGSGETVGFTKYVYMPAGTGPYHFPENTYFIDALLIDAKHQGKGYGEASLTEILRQINTAPWGAVEAIRLSCYDRNTSAIQLYQKHGFVKTQRLKKDDAIYQWMP